MCGICVWRMLPLAEERNMCMDQDKKKCGRCPVAANPYGVRYFNGTEPLSPEDEQRILGGPIAAVQRDLDHDCKIPIVVTSR